MPLKTMHFLGVLSSLVTGRKMERGLTREALKDGKASKTPRDGQLDTLSKLTHSSTLYLKAATVF